MPVRLVEGRCPDGGQAAGLRVLHDGCAWSPALRKAPLKGADYGASAATVSAAGRATARAQPVPAHCAP